MSKNRLNFQYDKEKGITTDLEAEEQVLAYLMDVVNEYSENYNNSEYSSEEILKDIDSNPSKIKALTESINSIEENEGLDFNIARNDYTVSEITNYEKYIEEIGNDKNFLLNSIGAEAIDMSNKYYKSQDRIKGTPIKFNANKNTNHIDSALDILENDREQQSSQAEMQQQNTENNNQINSRNKLNKIGELFKRIFGGNKNFEKEVITPAEGQVEGLSRENSSNEANIFNNLQNFIDEKVTSKIPKLQDINLNSLDNFKEQLLESQDLGKLSQNWNEQFYNYLIGEGDLGEVEKLGKRVVSVGRDQEFDRYKNMNENEMANSAIAEGIAALETEEYKQRNPKAIEVDEKRFNKMIEAMKIARREKYINNDFNANVDLLKNKIVNIDSNKTGGRKQLGELSLALDLADYKRSLIKNEYNEKDFMKKYESNEAAKRNDGGYNPTPGVADAPFATEKYANALIDQWIDRYDYSQETSIKNIDEDEQKIPGPAHDSYRE